MNASNRYLQLQKRANSSHGWNKIDLLHSVAKESIVVCDAAEGIVAINEALALLKLKFDIRNYVRDGLHIGVQLLRTRAAIYLSQCDFHGAAASFAEAIQIQYDHSMLSNSIAWQKEHLQLLQFYSSALAKADETKKSIEIREKAIAWWNSHPQIHLLCDAAFAMILLLTARAASNMEVDLTLPEAISDLDYGNAIFLSHRKLLEGDKFSTGYLNFSLLRARAHGCNGKYASALKCIDEAISACKSRYRQLRSRDLPEAFLWLLTERATILYKGGNYDLAIDTFFEAIELFSSKHGTCTLEEVGSGLFSAINLMTMLFCESRYEEAEKVMKIARKIECSNSDLMNHVYLEPYRFSFLYCEAELAFAKGRTTDAIKYCDRAIALKKSIVRSNSWGINPVIEIRLHQLKRSAVLSARKLGRLVNPFDIVMFLKLATRLQATRVGELGARPQIDFLMETALRHFRAYTRHNSLTFVARFLGWPVHALNGWAQRTIVPMIVELLLNCSLTESRWWSDQTSKVALIGHKFRNAVERFYAPLSAAWLHRLTAERSGHTHDTERVQFQRFMHGYLALAHAQGRVDLLPRILAVLHGRKLLEIVLADLDDTAADAGLSAAQVEMRQHLRQLRAEIETLRAQLSRGSGLLLDRFTDPSTRTRGEPSLESIQAADEARIQQEQALLTQLKERMDALQDLIRTDPDLAQLTGTVQVTPRILRERLTPGEGLIILAPSQTTETGAASGPVTAYVMLADAPGDGFALAFAGLTEHSQRLLRIRSLPCMKHLGGDVALRDGTFGNTEEPAANDADLPELLSDLSGYQSLLRTQFWDRLRDGLQAQGVDSAVLDAIATWHVAITGSLYTLPWAESAPVECIVHPALPFFLKAPSPARVEVPIALSTCAGEHHLDTAIPAVFLETALLRRLWTTEPEDARACIESHRAVGIAHFSCHGSHDEHDPVHSHLLLKDAQGHSGRWETREVMRSRATPHTAVLSACLAGRSTADAEGDPMGLASALMLRHTRQVIGALVSVPDGAMCWFGVMLQWHLAQDMPVRRALALTQRAFGEAAWPTDFIGFLNAHLPAALTEALGQLQEMLEAHHCNQGQRRDLTARFIGELVPDHTVTMTKYRVPAAAKLLPPAEALATEAGRHALAAILAQRIVQVVETPSRYPDSYRQLPFFVRAFG